MWRERYFIPSPKRADHYSRLMNDFKLNPNVAPHAHSQRQALAGVRISSRNNELEVAVMIGSVENMLKLLTSGIAETFENHGFTQKKTVFLKKPTIIHRTNFLLLDELVYR